MIENGIEEMDPQETKHISLLSVVMFITSEIVLAHRFENVHMRYNADTLITDYTSSIRFCVVCRLAINQNAYGGEI